MKSQKKDTDKSLDYKELLSELEEKDRKIECLQKALGAGYLPFKLPNFLNNIKILDFLPGFNQWSRKPDIINRIMPLFLILLGASLTGCSYFNPLVSELASTSSENFFTPKQQGDMVKLLDGILYSEECDELTDAIDSNPTIRDLEDKYEVEEGFLYNEMLHFFTPQYWTRTSQESYLARGIVTAWLAEKDFASVKFAVEKVQKCY